INFSVHKESDVNLSIYNLLGELVSTLVNEQKKPGHYEYAFNASELPSGIYLYSIKAGSFMKIKKMVFLR
ncbi:MAG: T9SS type A sorting domain-containing protein, partial [Ignavibacteria bacterium]|nr:T9SS type A sorting domain-containing protein [Ignavibacteria bacterium]